jgi:outer membrane protein assembly factor BamD
MPPKSPLTGQRALAPALCIASLLALGNAGCMFRHPPQNTNPLAKLKSEQPDKQLFDVAMSDMDKGKYTVARLNLETLLNTYPDSEYLARAKMAVADSWYREGGIEGLAQAEAQYKDFITFFPEMKEASEAQLKVAQIHYRQLQKPDRDPTQAVQAQAELRTFLVNYPDSPLRKQALQMLREVQEVLAEGEYRIGAFYLDRAHQGDFSDYRAAQSRLEAVLRKYPLYSRGDEATDELANSYLITSGLYAAAVRFEPNKETKNLYQANANEDRAKAIAGFGKLIQRYPLSPYVKDAKEELTRLHVPVPVPTPAEIAFNRTEIADRAKQPHVAGIAAIEADISAMWSGKPTTEIERADKVGTPALAMVETPPPAPPPGLNQLIHDTMVATGAIPANAPANTSLTAALTGAGGGSAGAGAGKGANATTTATAAPTAPLAFENVPTESKSQGAAAPPTDTPQATSGNNFTDPNAVQSAAMPTDNLLLTPNEVDLENRDEILAAAIHRDVPPPASQLAATAKREAAAEKKMLAKLKKDLKAEQEKKAKEAKPKDPHTPPTPPAAKSSGAGV